MTQPGYRVPSRAKAVVGAIGATLTAVSSFLAAVALVVGDDAISFEEVGSLVTSFGLLAGTAYGIWKTPYFRTPSE